MSMGKFRGWFTDVGFTCRVLIICDMLEEFADMWGAHPDSPFWNAIAEVRETALLEMARWEEIAEAEGYFAAEGTDMPKPQGETLGPIVK